MKLKLLFPFINSLIIFCSKQQQTIGFKENKGQIIDQNGKPNDAVKYLLNSAGLNVQLKRMDFHMTFMKPKTSYKTTHRRKRAFPSLEHNDKNP
jgi:hypothetical protein